MVSLLLVGVIIGVFVIGAVGWDVAFKEHHAVPETSDELHHVETDDGVEIGVHRHLPDGGDGEPVLVVHGLSANHRNVAFDGRHGVAQYLSERGYDCWVPDLRGRADSEVPDESWSYDHYVEQDLPAAIDHALAETGADRLHWVGHSMGGMLYYNLAGGREYDDAIASGVTLGSPVQFRRHRGKFLYYLSLLGLFSRPVFGFPKRLLLYPFSVRWLAFTLPVIPHALARSVLTKSNVDFHRIRQAANECMAMVSPRVLLNFCDWIVHDRWKSEDRTVNYRRRVEEIETPTRMIAGGGDHLCPAADIEAGYDDVPADAKDYVEASTAEGYADDYGHVDLVFGQEAPDELYPLIDDWFERHPVEGGVATADAEASRSAGAEAEARE